MFPGPGDLCPENGSDLTMTEYIYIYWIYIYIYIYVCMYIYLKGKEIKCWHLLKKKIELVHREFFAFIL